MKVIVYDYYLKVVKYNNVVDVHVTVCDTKKWFDGEEECIYQTMNVDLGYDNGHKSKLTNVYDIEIL